MLKNATFIGLKFFLKVEQVLDAFFLTIKERVCLSHEEGKYFLELNCSFKLIPTKT